LKPIVSKAIICPTNPLVPIPAPAALFVIFNQTVAKGTRIIPATVGGISIKGFLMMFGTCNMEVPIAWAKSLLFHSPYNFALQNPSFEQNNQLQLHQPLTHR